MPRHIVPPRWKKGESGNPNGRPPKLLTKIIKDLKERGYEEVKAAQVAEAYSTIIGLDDKEIQKISRDSKAPIILRIAAKSLLDKKSSRAAIEMMLDRAHGRTKAVEDIGGDKTGEVVIKIKR